MTDQRTLPIPSEHREFVVKAGGQEVGREHQLIAASVVKAANRISSARLVYLDGAAGASDFPLSKAGTFVPGTEIEVLAGAPNDLVSLFKGIVVRQSIKIRSQVAPQLVVDCRHAASRLTVGRRSACYLDQTDGDVLGTLLERISVPGDIATTAVRHAQLVQFRSTDWDFLLTRAAANGLLVFTNDDRVAVQAPDLAAAAVVPLQFGATVLEMDAEIDTRMQFAAVVGRTWDPGQQALVEKEAEDPAVKGPGNLTTSDLAAVVGLEKLELRHPAITEDEAQAWADGEWLRSQIGRVRGRVKCEGIATVNPGQRATLGGAGDRYNGDVYVTGVRQDLDLTQGWKTHVQFGALEALPGSESTVAAPPAAGLLPGVRGLQIGVVTSNEDPEGEHRVRVRLPLDGDDPDGVWARVAVPDAGDGRGFFFHPEIGDEVLLGFLDEDPRRAVILGMLHSSARPAPLMGSDDNHEKVWQTRSKMKVYFNDDTRVLSLETPAGNKVTLSEADKVVSLVDQSGNKLEMTPDGIVIESARALTLKAGTDMSLESRLKLDAKGGTDVTIEGIRSAELSSTATASLKGGVVQIN